MDPKTTQTGCRKDPGYFCFPEWKASLVGVEQGNYIQLFIGKGTGRSLSSSPDRLCGFGDSSHLSDPLFLIGGKEGLE